MLAYNNLQLPFRNKIYTIHGSNASLYALTYKKHLPQSVKWYLLFSTTASASGSLQSWLWVLLSQRLLVHAVQVLSELLGGLRALKLKTMNLLAFVLR